MTSFGYASVIYQTQPFRCLEFWLHTAMSFIHIIRFMVRHVTLNVVFGKVSKTAGCGSYPSGITRFWLYCRCFQSRAKYGNITLPRNAISLTKTLPNTFKLHWSTITPSSILLELKFLTHTETSDSRSNSPSKRNVGDHDLKPTN